MSDRPRVVVRTCPDCGALLLATAGLPWMTCTGCPLALDPLGVPAERLPTFRPAGPGTDVAQRLAFYVFESGPPESPAWIWIPAFRALSTNSRSDPGAVLEQKGYRPGLVAAPLGAPLARTPSEARVLAALRLGVKAADADLRAARLVSLACRVSMGNVAEKVSGFVCPFEMLRPPVG